MMLYQEKYDLFLSDFTGDLEAYSLDNITEWNKESGWDDVTYNITLGGEDTGCHGTLCQGDSAEMVNLRVRGKL